MACSVCVPLGVTIGCVRLENTLTDLFRLCATPPARQGCILGGCTFRDTMHRPEADLGRYGPAAARWRHACSLHGGVPLGRFALRDQVNATRYVGSRCTPMLEMTCFGGPGSVIRPLTNPSPCSAPRPQGAPKSTPAGRWDGVACLCARSQAIRPRGCTDFAPRHAERPAP